MRAMKTVHLLEDSKVRWISWLIQCIIAQYIYHRNFLRKHFTKIIDLYILISELNHISSSSQSQLADWGQNKMNNSKSKECVEWIQSGCPLGSNMLINTCPSYKTKILSNNNQRTQDRKGQRRRARRSRQIIGTLNKMKYSFWKKIVSSFFKYK